MRITLSKILALLIATGYVIAFLVSEGADWQVIKLLAGLVFPLVFIWFPEEMGSLSGFVVRGSYVNAETPAFLVSLGGWFILVGLPIILLLLQ